MTQRLRVLRDFTAEMNGNRFPLQAGQEFAVPAWFATLAEIWIQAGLAERVVTGEANDGKEVSEHDRGRPEAA